MRLIERVVSRKGMSFGGSGSFTLPSFWTNEAAQDHEDIACNFEGFVSGAFKASSPVFTCVALRSMVFSQARPRFRRFDDGELFGSTELALLERPWPGGSLSELLVRMEQDASLAGNFYATMVDDRYGRRIRRMRPDWVTIVTGSESGDPAALDARVVGYIYHPNGSPSESKTVLLTPDKVAHYSPMMDPDAQWRGMSWLTPIIREIQGDLAASDHKLKYFKNGTVGGIAISYEAGVSPESIERFAELFRQSHAGTDNAYKTFHFGGGADVKTIGADLKQLDFKVTQGHNESRIAAASGVGAVMAQLSEGLQGSSLNQGNYDASRHRLRGVMDSLWTAATEPIANLVTVPAGSELVFDASGVAFLQENQRDAADILASQAQTLRTLVDAGFNPDASIRAIRAGDVRSLLGAHSGFYSVQLRPPGDMEDESSD